jgi:hypothetical protein
MHYLTAADRFLEQAIPNACTAKTLPPSQRMQIGLQALAGSQPVTELSKRSDVSRKFVYEQKAKAKAALDEAFLAGTDDDKVLFHLPVTRAWLRQFVLALTLICHSSLRGVVEILRDLFNYDMSLGDVHNIVSNAVKMARAHNRAQDLAYINMAALDEIFQAGWPVLVGVDVRSSFCFLLNREEHRDEDTWALRLLELKERNFAPAATIADFAAAIRAGQNLAELGATCRGDVFHLLQEVTPVVTYLENRAYEAIDAHSKLAQKKAKTKRQGKPTLSLACQAAIKHREAEQAITLADDVTMLARWLHYDVFAVSGLAYADRCALYDFILSELQTRVELCSHRLKPICTLLEKQRDKVLAFAAELDRDLISLAKEFQVPEFLVRQLLDVQALPEQNPKRWQKEAELRQKLDYTFHSVNEAVQDLKTQVVRASSVVENLNSRLRSYFFLRRHLGPDYLELLQFFLNHRRFLRSQHAERVGKSPAELLTGVKHPHWLEMLGFTLFSPN